MYPSGKILLNAADDEAWLELLIRSVNEPTINGVEMPRYPHPSSQIKLVGSADAHAMHEGYRFFQYVKAYAEALAMPLHPRTKVLDFGTGWGRMARLLWGDIGADSIFGVDVDPELVAVAKHLGGPGAFSCIEPKGRLPYPNSTFDLIVAYSVFSHLPEMIAKHWMAELSRVAKSGCVFVYTTESRRFLDFILEIPDNSPSEWHQGLAKFKGSVPPLLRKFDHDEFCYIPTSGGDHLSGDVYGDAVVPESYIEKKWGKYFAKRAYIDDPDRFWEALVVTQKP